MVNLLLKHVLGVGADHKGVYGDTAGYYDTVEQQGRLSLHLHMLVWIQPLQSKSVIVDAPGAFRKGVSNRPDAPVAFLRKAVGDEGGAASGSLLNTVQGQASGRVGVLVTGIWGEGGV